MWAKDGVDFSFLWTDFLRHAWRFLYLPLRLRRLEKKKRRGQKATRASYWLRGLGCRSSAGPGRLFCGAAGLAHAISWAEEVFFEWEGISALEEDEVERNATGDREMWCLDISSMGQGRGLFVDI